MKLKIITLILLLCIASLILMSCKDTSLVSNQKQDMPIPTKTPLPKYEVTFFEPKIFGSEKVIVCAEILIIDPNALYPEAIGFLIKENNIEQAIYNNSTLIENKIYAILPKLKENTSYDLGVWYFEGTKKIIFDNFLNISTPKRTLSLEDIDKYIYDEFSEISVNDENRILLETQACMAFLGMETGSYGIMNSLFQSNLCRLEYSLNSYGNWVDYDKIIGIPNEDTLLALKNILSYDILTLEKDIVNDFIPTPYALSKYALVNEKGGGLDIESYILELVYEKSEVLEIYKEYPYDKSTDEFKEKYEELINNALNEETLTKKIDGICAKNKALFSNHARDWMRTIALPSERLITLAGSDDELTINTLTAYSYLFIDAYRETGKKYKTSTTYRTYNFQWDLYSKGAGKAVSYRKNESWHLDRQRLSYVPGFSNHQYGVAIDFYDRKTFGATKLFSFIRDNGSKYGFYNYYIEPWHWVYLGIPD
jgi:LAS superfamily LD-carboxypeptidase LdcB